MAQGANSDLSMVGHDQTGWRIVATQDHVATSLPPEHETDAFQGDADFLAR